ncbi:ATP-binding cassette domain-containing protein [Acidiferrimicrobium sp. IK]|uniref:ABC-F family ATP-binding cassette domain-containing protein n=1 Tax=Acidiferrimicrobium sp. IK TaxID=2871700 RepID=UPI0021CB62FF|nr:ABC-F family ATP-binding cassette domain-containing protein [Acidiferrimicrobium sp. IK]MCU4185974.1 ATP-binding cassette domain-containing protein [Acidiferrimicrobium sp. IK]
MLQARQLSVEVGGRLTLEEASFVVRAGDKVGLVGRNGAGKTSLFKVLGGEAPAYDGQVSIQGQLGFLSQDPRKLKEATDSTGLAYVLSGKGLDEAAQRVEKLRLAMEEDPSERAIHRFAKAEEAFASAGGYAAESEVRSLVAGLGLTADRIDLPIDVLSGGERRRVELARILFAGSEVLLLDEPTNHLDSDAKAWLMGFLRSYRGALLVISHDLDLLDEAITRVLHLDEGQIHEYKGTYSQYRTARAADEIRLGRLADRQQAEIKRLSTLADSMRGQTAKRARVAKSLDKRASRLTATAVSGPTSHERKYRVKFPTPPASGRIVLEVTDVAKSYGGPPVFTDVSFAVERGQRLLIMGLNGAGKTSLLRILAGQSSASAGSYRTGLNVSPGYYAQEHEGIRPGVPVLDHMRSSSPIAERELRALLGMFGLYGDIAFQDASTLSGGEKTKLALAQLVAGNHNLLLLDEPTNNLDPPSRTAIGSALADWPGTMIVVSHDAEFVTELAPDRVLLMPDGTEDAWSDDLLDLVAMA